MTVINDLSSEKKLNNVIENETKKRLETDKHTLENCSFFRFLPLFNTEKKRKKNHWANGKPLNKRCSKVFGKQTPLNEKKKKDGVVFVETGLLL